MLKISLDPRRGNEGKLGPWVHFDRFEKVIYLWRYERPYLGTYEGIGYGVGGATYGSTHAEVTGSGDSGGYALPVNRIPEECKVPTVRLSVEESRDWANGAIYDWAKELFPPEHREEIGWRTSKHQPPATILNQPQVRRP